VALFDYVAQYEDELSFSVSTPTAPAVFPCFALHICNVKIYIRSTGDDSAKYFGVLLARKDPLPYYDEEDSPLCESQSGQPIRICRY
jgi:hypothetical protein